MFFAPVVRTRAAVPAHRSFDRSFERFVNDAFFSNSVPGFNVTQDDKAWTVTLDLPDLEAMQAAPLPEEDDDGALPKLEPV